MKREGYDCICSRCGKNIKLLFRPNRDLPIYCKRCYILSLTETINNSVKILKQDLDDRGIEQGVQLLVFNIKRFGSLPGQFSTINEVKKGVFKRIKEEIKDKNKVEKILILFERLFERLY